MTARPKKSVDRSAAAEKVRAALAAGQIEAVVAWAVKGLQFGGRAGPRAEAKKAKRHAGIAVQELARVKVQNPDWTLDALAKATSRLLKERLIRRSPSTIRKDWQRSNRGRRTSTSSPNSALPQRSLGAIH